MAQFGLVKFFFTHEILGGGSYGLLTQEDDDSIYEGMKRMIESKSLRQEYATRALEGAGTFDAKSVMSDIYRLL